MRTKLPLLLLFLLPGFIGHAQVKFRVKKLDTDSLAALIPSKKGTDKIDGLNLLSNAISRKSPDSSALLANMSITLATDQGYTKGLAVGYFNLGNAWYLRDSLEPTISNYLKALRIFEDLGPSHEYGNLCLQLSHVYYFTGARDKIFSYADRASRIFHSIADREGLFLVAFTKGVYKLEMPQEWDSALFFYNKALTYLDPSLSPDDRTYIYCDMAEVSQYQFNSTSDSSYLHAAFSYANKAAGFTGVSPEAQAWTCLHLADLNMKLGTASSVAKGMAWYQKADSLAGTSFDAFVFRVWVYKEYAEMSFLRGATDRAAGLFRQVIGIVDERLTTYSINDYKEPTLGHNWNMYMKGIKAHSYERLYDIYAGRGDYKTAHEYYVLGKEAREKIFLEKNQKMITMMEATSREERDRSRIDLLARDNMLQEVRIRQSRGMAFAVAGLFVILVLIGLLFLRQNKLKNDNRTVVLEQKLLRSQMNPHFIFNSLANIQEFIWNKDSLAANEYLSSFSKLVRLILENSRSDFVSVGKEISTIEHYLNLQKLRFRDKLEYSIEVDPDIDDEEMLIPPMLVQPFIENSIEHGIRKSETTGHVHVRFSLRDDQINIEVKDNGIGFVKSAELKKDLQKDHQSLAMTITQERLQMHFRKYRRKIRLTISDLTDENKRVTGAQVVFGIPYNLA